MEEVEQIVQCNHSENYKTVWQDEIQNAYSGHTCYSILTACGYYKTNDKLIKNPITIKTETSDHSRITTFTSFSKILHTIQLKMQVPLRKVFMPGAIEWAHNSSTLSYSSFWPHFIAKLIWNSTLWRSIMVTGQWMVLVEP